MGLHLTKQRQAVLDIVQAADDHPTAADIIHRLRDQNYSFAYATVYNSLKYLVDHRLVTELRIDNAVTRYDGRMEEHHHAICEQCGTVLEVLVELPDAFLRQIESQTGIEITAHHLVLHAICEECRGSMSEPKS
jgi:Fur family transcriptional regulator, peroxide stress response regulator